MMIYCACSSSGCAALGQAPEQLFALRPEQIPGVPLENYRRYEAHAAVLRPLMDSREVNRVRVASQRDRASTARKLIRPHAPGWSDAELDAMIGAVWVLNAPQVWRWLRDTWGVENDEAARPQVGDHYFARGTRARPLHPSKVAAQGGRRPR